MKMNPADIKSHKGLVRFVTGHMPLLAKDPKLIQAIQECAGNIDAAKIRHALQWNTLPQIEIKALTSDGRQTPAGGYTAHSNRLTLNAYHVGLHEDGEQDVRSTPKRGQVHLVEVDLLHELTHWAKEQAGGADSGGPEEGFEFERKFYGCVVE